MRSLLIIFCLFVSPILNAQWNKTGRPHQQKNDYYRAAKAYQEVVDTSDVEDILSYARVLYYQGKIGEAQKYFTILAHGGHLNQTKDLTAFSTCNQITKFKTEEEFRLLFGGLFTVSNVRGFKDKLPGDKQKYLVQSSCFNSDDFEDFCPTVIANKLCVVSARPSKNDALGKYKYNNQYFYDLYEVNGCDLKLLRDDKNLPKGINTKLHDGPAHYSDDAKRFFLTRNIEYSDNINLGIVYSELNERGVWSNWKSFEYNTAVYNVQHPFFDTASQKLYFSSDMPGGYGSFDLYYSQLTDSGWSIPSNCGSAINTSGDEVFPNLHNGELYFSSNGIVNKGGLDLFKWDGNTLYAMNSLNSVWDDYGVYFISDSSGFFTTNRSNGFGHDDVLQFELIQQQKPEDTIQVSTIKPSIVKTELGTPMIAGLQISIFDAVDQSWVELPKLDIEVENLLSGVKSEFTVQQDSVKIKLGYLSSDSVFKITIDVNREGYKTKRVVYKAVSPRDGKLDLGKIYLFREPDYKPKPKNGKIGLPIVYFDLDKSNIRKSETHKLDSIFNILKAQESIKLEIKAYTDSRASFDYNLKLAERRAKSSIKYLTDKGIDRDRCVFAVYGETNLVNDCGDNKECAEQFHQLNRRVEFNLLD